MPLSGLEIYKLLPKTNCKACGFPTCLAFAMKLAQQGIELSACPHVSEQAKQALAASARPAMLPIAVGTGERAFTVGNETVHTAPVHRMGYQEQALPAELLHQCGPQTAPISACWRAGRLSSNVSRSIQDFSPLLSSSIP